MALQSRRRFTGAELARRFLHRRAGRLHVRNARRYTQNFLLVTPGSSAEDPRGVAPDLARELARRLGVPIAFSKYDTAGKLADGVKTGAWDVAFLGAEPQRAN